MLPWSTALWTSSSAAHGVDEAFADGEPQAAAFVAVALGLRSWKNSSKMFRRCSGAMPMPLSLTRICNPPSAARNCPRGPCLFR